MRALYGFLILLISGCATVGVTRLQVSAEPKPIDCKLDIYSDEREIKRPFEVVCLLDAKTGTAISENRTGPGAINLARQHACSCGADGMLILSMGTGGDGFLIPRTGSAILKAIKYK